MFLHNIFCLRFDKKPGVFCDVFCSNISLDIVFLATLQSNSAYPLILGGKKESTYWIWLYILKLILSNRGWLIHLTVLFRVLALFNVVMKNLYPCSNGSVQLFADFSHGPFVFNLFICLELLTYNIINLLFLFPCHNFQYLSICRLAMNNHFPKR